jgi:hypothetical protein
MKHGTWNLKLETYYRRIYNHTKITEVLFSPVAQLVRALH